VLDLALEGGNPLLVPLLHLLEPLFDRLLRRRLLREDRAAQDEGRAERPDEVTWTRHRNPSPEMNEGMRSRSLGRDQTRTGFRRRRAARARAAGRRRPPPARARDRARSRR